MKIAIGQINTTVGDIAGNVGKMIEYADRARVAGADLIVFHELCVPGYPPKELAERHDFVSANWKTLDRLKEQCRGIGVVCGFIEREGEGSRARTYATSVLLRDGEVVFRHRKNVLAAFTGFDEKLHFSVGDGGAVGDVEGVKIGLAVSEEAWTDKDFWEREREAKSLPGRLVADGARLLIVIGASPFWPGKRMERERAAGDLASRHGVPIVFVNQVGGNDSLIFDGGSFAVSPEGRVIARAKRFEEDLLIVDVEQPAEAAAAEEDQVEEIRRALVLGVRDYVRKSGFEKAVLGLSGGIDSVVTACIAVEALGKENVVALWLPSMYSSQRSLRDAKSVAERLGVKFQTVSIGPVYDAYVRSLRGVFKGLPEDVTEENIQARIRGNILMAFSNKMRCLVLATGNRSEVMTGYCTLYGDLAGALGVIGDVPKTMVYRLAERFESASAGELIPRSVMEKEPSAELKPGQKDADTLPPYDVLDPILAALLDEGKTPDEIAAMGYADMGVVRDVVRRVYRSEHKRRQSPPVLFVSRSALVPGRTRPLAAAIEDISSES